MAAIEIVEGSERDLGSRLARGRIDLAVTVLRSHAPGAVDHLFSDEYVLALPRWHRYADAASVHPQDLAEEVMIVRRHCEALSDVSRYFVDHGVRPRFSFRTTNDDKAVAMVRAGLGITVMPRSYFDPDIRQPRLAGFDLSRDIGIIAGPHMDDAELAGGVDALRALIKTVVTRL